MRVTPFARRHRSPHADGQRGVNSVWHDDRDRLASACRRAAPGGFSGVNACEQNPSALFVIIVTK